jgi:hypothetical protein
MPLLGWVRKAIGEPSVFGTQGTLKASGSRAPAYLFPHRDIFPFGTAFTEVQSEATQLMHTFTLGHKNNPAAKIYQRMLGASRGPLQQIYGLSVPEMADAGVTHGGGGDVGKKVEERIDARMEAELDAMINALATGALKFEDGRIQRSNSGTDVGAVARWLKQ